MQDSNQSPSQRLRDYFKVPSADLERLLLAVEDTEKELAKLELQLQDLIQQLKHCDTQR